MFKRLSHILINLTKIDQAIADESRRARPSTTKLLRLKALKLSVKNHLWQVLQPMPALQPAYTKRGRMA